MMAIEALGCAAILAWLAVANSFRSLGGVPIDVKPGQVFAAMLDQTFLYSSGYI